MLISYRLLSVIAFTSSITAAYVIYRTKNNLLFLVLIIIGIGSTVLNWGNRGTIPEIDDQKLATYLPYSTSREEGAWNAVTISRPITSIWQTEIPPTHLESLTGKLEINRELRKTNYHLYEVTNEKSGLVKENTYYFPNWKLLIDGNEHEILYEDQRFPGIITFTLNEGFHTVELIFQESTIEKSALMVSITTIFISGIYLLLKGITLRELF